MDRGQPDSATGATVADLIVEARDGLERRGEPVTCGIPWPRGGLADPSLLGLVDAEGRPVPVQASSLDRWSDGSVRWVLLDWQADVVGSATYRVSVLAPETPPVASPVSVAAGPGGEVVVETSRASFVIRAGSPALFRSIKVAGADVIVPARTGFTAKDGSGRVFEAVASRLEVFETGPLRAVVRAEGELVSAGVRPLARFTLDLEFFAGSATVRCSATILNPRKARHPGGLWELGGDGSITIRDASVKFAMPDGPGETTILCSVDRQSPPQHHAGDFELYQDSSGGENWAGSVHINAGRTVATSFRGYRLRADGREKHGLRASPVVAIGRGGQTLAIAVEHFWENFPKAIEVSSGTLTLRLFPGQFADLHELQGGEQKTHEFVVAFADDRVTETPLAWCRAPMVPRATPSWYASSGAIPHLSPSAEDSDHTYLSLVDAAIKGDDTFERKREVIDEYGWRHFGEVYADHEAVFHSGPAPLVSHYNNQYDNIAGFAYQFLRGGDARWWAAMAELARHVVDIDIYHTDDDRSAYNHGLFWHTCHYVDADTGTHRAYPKAGDVCGGGPSGGHAYTTGLMLHHFLTGNSRTRAAALELGRWVVDMDDGRKTIFRWLDSGHHGHATASGSASYHGPGRAAANSVNALLDAHRLSGDPQFLAKAEQLIRRCIHPDDDIQARDLLDAENKWFYTMFLQTLGKYLDGRAEAGALGFMYAYARESLLRYARWMAANEYPYLDKPERLEYPTETWAAQDMRKCEVFQYAAKHGDPDERTRFLERAHFFFTASTETLASKPTRSLARPVVLLLVNGWSHAYFRANPEATAPVPASAVADFGKPEVFVPQKVRAIRKLKKLVIAASFFLLGLLLLGLVAIFS